MNSLLSLGGWSIIPDLVTKHLLDFLYRNPLTSRFFRLTPAAPGTPQYRKHYGYTFAFVVLGYLLYNMVQSARTMEPNFYQILGVPPNADETELKLAFRQFVKRNHPDRPEIGKNGEERFMMVRDAFEALKDPVVRFAYDRFGPVVLPWRKHCSTMHEFLHHGLMRSSIYHFVTGIFLLFWSAVSQRTPISFWRYILFFALFATEMALILSSPSNSTILSFFFPYRSTHQHILFLHQLFLFLSIALTRVAPYLLPLDEELNPNMQQALLERIQTVVAIADRETSIMLHTELNSINHPPPPPSKKITVNDPCFARMRPVSQQRTTELIAQLTPEMEALIIESNIKQESGPLRSAWDAALKRVSSQPQLRRANNFWEATTGGEVAGSGYYVVPSASFARPSPIPPSIHNGSPERGIDRDLAEGADARGRGMSL